jgi:hypothetical protein
VPTAFSWAGQTLSAEAVQLSTVPRRDGSLDIVLRYYEDAILDDADSTADVNAEPIAEIILLRDVFRFEWYAVDAPDGRTMEESDTWDVHNRRPLQLKLDVVFHANSDRIVHYFWLPPKVDPATIVRGQQLPGARQTPEGQPQPGDPNNPRQPRDPNNPDVQIRPGDGNGPRNPRPGNGIRGGGPNGNQPPIPGGGGPTPGGGR